MTTWPAPQDATKEADCKSLCKCCMWYSDIIESLLVSCDTKHLHLWLFPCLSLMMFKSSVFKVSKEIKWTWPFTKNGSAHIPKRVLWTPNPAKSHPPHLENRQNRIKTCYFKQWKTQKAKNKDCIPMFLSSRQVRFPQIWREWRSNTKYRGLLF